MCLTINIDLLTKKKAIIGPNNALKCLKHQLNYIISLNFLEVSSKLHVKVPQNKLYRGMGWLGKDPFRRITDSENYSHVLIGTYVKDIWGEENY